MVATSEVSISLTLDPSKIWSRDLIDDELDGLVASFGDIARVSGLERPCSESTAPSGDDAWLVISSALHACVAVRCSGLEGRRHRYEAGQHGGSGWECL